MKTNALRENVRYRLIEESPHNAEQPTEANNLSHRKVSDGNRDESSETGDSIGVATSYIHNRLARPVEGRGRR